MDSEIVYLLSQEAAEGSAGRNSQATSQTSPTNATVINFTGASSADDFVSGDVVNANYGLTVPPGVWSISASIALTLTGSFSNNGWAIYEAGLATITSGGAVDTALNTRSTVAITNFTSGNVIDINVSGIYNTSLISPTLSKTIGLVFYVQSGGTTVATIATLPSRTFISVSSV